MTQQQLRDYLDRFIETLGQQDRELVDSRLQSPCMKHTDCSWRALWKKLNYLLTRGAKPFDCLKHIGLRELKYISRRFQKEYS